MDQLSFVDWCRAWLTASRPLMKPGAPFGIMIDWRQLGALCIAVQQAGLMWRGVAVWDKTKAARPQAGRYRQQAEFIVWGTNGPVSPRPVYAPGIFTHRPDKQDKRFHLTGKPVALMRDLLAIVPAGGTVLDPLAGAGSTDVAALEGGLSFIGVEQSAEYAAIAAQRLQAAEGGD